MNGRNYLSLTLLGVALVLVAPDLQAKQVVGWVENARVYPGDIRIRAKLDTGAKTSSLNCECQSTFDREGEKWVRFTLTNYRGRTVQIERKIHRIARIRRHGGRIQERIVIKLGVCLADVYKEIDVNLIDRSGFNYQMLVGRTFLKGDFIVDPSVTFTAAPECKGAPET